jgi:hypothetical protein
MGAPTPQVLLEAIANSAAAGTSPGDKTAPMPDAPPGGNLASIQGGFPANTMESELAGGLPPFGQDMNGYLFLISSHTLYVECGQLYSYNSTLATAIGGYLAGSILGMADGTGMWLCTTNGNTNNPDTGGAGWVPIAAYGKTVINSLTGGTVALTPAQSKYSVIVLNGVLVSPLTIQLPQNDQEWLIVNNTSGSFTTTVLTAASGSVGVQIPQGGFGAPTGVYSIGDGNIYPTVAAFGFSISVAPTANSIVQRNNLGYVLATYFNTSAGVDNLTPSTVFTNSGDGYIRQNTLTNFESFLLLQAMGGQVTNGQVPYSVVQQWVSTFLNNAALTGTPTAPTPGAGTNNTEIATTAFVTGSASFAGGNGAGTQSSFTLPNGVIVKFGQTGFFSGGSFNVVFATPFPTIGYIAAPFGVATTNQVNSAAVPGTNGFTINGGSSGITCMWLAIGR